MKTGIFAYLLFQVIVGPLVILYVTIPALKALTSTLNAALTVH